MDISNGSGIGIALFVQGCHFHCKNCFNQETWDFLGGKEWTKEIREDFINLINSNVQRVSILGGEPLALENIDDVLDLTQTIKDKHPNVKIWLYTGYNWDYIYDQRWHYHPVTNEKLLTGRFRREQIIKLCDVVVDGLYFENKADRTYKYAGSTNQRVIDAKKSIERGDVVLWSD